MTTAELRKKYLNFFTARGHAIIPSARILPENDPTTLFTGSGMQPMIPYLLGEAHPKGARVADSQKCFRTQDIEEVGDNRHTTFFEMLGNWSLGDYFKREQIPWLFEFLTRELGLDPSRLYVTCFRGNAELKISKDEETAALWQKQFSARGIDSKVVDFPERDGMQAGRIFFYDETKNWWSRAGVPGNMPVGEPGGPDSEVFWDFGVSLKLHEQSPWSALPCQVNCDCGRFLEIGNNVFMAYRKTAAGFEALPKKNVDFGGGLERMMAAVMDNPDIFRIDVFNPMRATLERVSRKKYGESEEVNKAFRVIMDHLRAAAFLIADGAHPSNKDQGYFTRRLMRRSIRYAHLLGITENFCGEVAASVIEAYQDAYPNLKTEEGLIFGSLQKEEDKFRRTLAKGLKVFEETVKNQTSGSTLSAKDTFDLYQSYGFPVEMTQELATEKGMSVDMAGFLKAQKQHQEISRQGVDKKFHGGLADQSDKTIMGHTATHLLHAALRRVLGEHVKQSGSNITPERVRFDFTHPARISEAEMAEIEKLINAAIARDYPVTWQEMKVDDAYRKKVLGFFPARYDEVVKVYSIGDPDQPANADPTGVTFSQEICGGPHVAHTGVIGHVRVVKEEALGVGMRRIKVEVEPGGFKPPIDIAPRRKD